MRPIRSDQQTGQDSTAGLSRDPADANGSVQNSFNAQTVQDNLTFSQEFGETATYAIGQAADKLEEQLQNSQYASLFAEGGAGRDAMHAAVAAIGAALSGGSVGGAVGGSLTGDELQSLAQPIIEQAISQLPASAQTAARNALYEVVAAAGGALGGAIAGGGSQGALAGIGTATDNEVYNRRFNKSETNAIETEANGNSAELAKLTTAACYVVSCWAQYPVGSAEYNDNCVSQAQLIGLQPELDWVTSQQSQGLFSYTFGQQGLDYLSSQQDAFIQGTLNLVPGRQMEVQAQAAYANGNYDSALALGVGSILDAGVGLVAIGGQAALSAADDAVAVASEQATDSSPGGLNLFKWGQDTTTTASGWTSGDYMLYLPNQGGAQANWAQNSSYLRQAMSEGNPIYDSYIDPTTGQQIPTGGFLNAERNLLQSKGWTFNSATGAYTPPKE